MTRTDTIARRAATGMRATVQTVILSTLLGLVKIASGLLGNSYALIADGIESTLDVVASLVVWGGLRIAARPPDHDHPYGHGKAEPLAAAVVALVLLGAALLLAVQSVREILTPHHAPAPFTLLVLVLVVATKELLFRRLDRIGRETESLSLRSDAWHHRSDAFTSAAAFVGITVAWIGGPGWESADDWAALFACAIIGLNGVRLLRAAVADVMDVAAPSSLLDSIRRVAEAVDDVAGVEKCLARKSGPGWLVDIHVEVDGEHTVAAGHRVAHAVKDALLGAELGILDALVHVEPAPIVADGPARPS